MRKSPLVAFLLASLLTATTTVGAPTVINYQGRMTDDTGILPESSYSMTFRLYADPTLPEYLWEEIQDVNVSDGLFSVTLGTFSPLDFSDMPVHPDFLWLGIQVGADAEILPRTRLTSVPSAAVASALQGDISANDGVLVLTDSLGDTTIVITGRRGQIEGMDDRAGSRIHAGRIILSDSLGDTAIILDAHSLRGVEIVIVNDPGRTYLGAGKLHLTDSLGDSTFHLQTTANATVEKFQHKQDFGPVKQNRQGVTDTSSFVEMLVFNDVDSSHTLVSAIESRSQLKTYFETGDVPTEAQFGSFIGSSLMKMTHDNNAEAFLEVSDSSAVMFMTKSELIEATSSTLVNELKGGSISRRSARTGRNPQTGLSIQMSADTDLNDTTGVGLSLRRLDVDSDNDGLLDLLVDEDGVSLRMNKVDQVDDEELLELVVKKDSVLFRCLSKADAKRALEALTTNNSVSLTLIDSTLNDSGLIGMSIVNGAPELIMSEDRDNGDGTSTRYDFTLLPDRIELSEAESDGGPAFSCTLDMEKFVRASVGTGDTAVNFDLSNASLSLKNGNAVLSGNNGALGGRLGLRGIGGGGLAFSCTLDMEKFVRASIDSGDSTFVLDFVNEKMSLRSPGGGGIPPSRVEISDLDLDGTLDLRVDGNVGVGTPTPSEKLHVIGNICATGTIGACSDERFKQDIDPLTNPIETINQLQGVNYSWRTNEFPEMKFSDKRQMGFIAQEIKEILPSVVSKGADGYYTVDYGKITPLLVEAFKAQQNKVDKMQTEIEELKALVSQLVQQNTSDENATYGIK